MFYTQHERPELPQRRGFERTGVTAVFGKCAITTAGAPNQQVPTFPNILPSQIPPVRGFRGHFPRFSAIHACPTLLQASLQIEREIGENTTLSIGTMWNHGVHMLSGSAYDLNLMPLTGTTTYIVCPPGTTTAPCTGPTIPAEHG
jgi:hypothetical protein